MRILLITSVYPTPRAPTKGTFNAALVTGLHLAGDDVRVIAPVPWTDRIRRRATGTTSEGVTHPVWFYPPRLGHASHHRWMGRSVVPAAVTLAEEWQPELVLGYWTHPDGTVALDVAERLEVPGVLMAGGSDIQLLTAQPARRRIIVETLERAAHVLTVGEPLRAKVLDLGLAPERVTAFARGVDRQRFAPGDRAAARQRVGLPTDRPVVLWVGRMVPVKGLEVLLGAWREVAHDPSRPLLVLAGDGEERDALEAMASGCGDGVRFVGPQPHAALADWYRAADLVVLPSRSEGVPNVLLEALACGTPFVASAVGGIPALLEPASRLVPPGDVGALTEALRERLDAPASTRCADARHVPDRAEGIAALRALFARVVDATPQAVAP